MIQSRLLGKCGQRFALSIRVPSTTLYTDVAMNITNQAIHQLSGGKKQELADILAAIPELAPPQGLEVLHLLLRLDRRFRPSSDGGWTLATVPPTRQQRVIASTQAYLNGIRGGGALLDSVVKHVIGETGYDSAFVRQVILRRFVNTGKVVRNQLKEAP